MSSYFAVSVSCSPPPAVRQKTGGLQVPYQDLPDLNQGLSRVNTNNQNWQYLLVFYFPPGCVRIQHIILKICKILLTFLT